MDYTTNYHLPQWAETDRVLMNDFNAAMLGIETGLDSAKRDMTDTANALRQEASAAETDLRSDARAKLNRLGHDIYQASAREMMRSGQRWKMRSGAFNGLEQPEELAKAGGIVHRAGGGGLLGDATALTLEKLNAAITGWENGEASDIGAAATAKVRFRSNFQGTITRLDTWYSRTTLTDTARLNLYIRLLDIATGTYAYQSPKLMGKVLTNVDTADSLTVAVPVEANHDYELELCTSGSVFSGTLGFGSKGTERLTGAVVGTPLRAAAFREDITPEVPAARVVAVIHHKGCVLSAKVNGMAMTAAAGKASVSAGGESCTEAEFFLTGAFTGTLNLEVTAQLSAAEGAVYDLGWYLV